MGTLIRPDGSETTVTPHCENCGFTLAEVYGLIECNFVEMQRLADGRMMLMDEDAKITQPRPAENLRATELLFGTKDYPDVVLGNVLVVTEKEFN